MADPFERIVRSPLEYSFLTDENGQFAQQIVKEMERTSNILMDATYMPTSEDSRHRGYRDEDDMKNTAVGLASDEGDAYSENGHEVMYSTEIGRIGDGCKYNSIQRRNSLSADVVERERMDISNTIEGINRTDAFVTVYGNSKAIADESRAAVNPKLWKGLAYYTRKISDRAQFEDDFYANKNPFKGWGVDDLCLAIDNRAKDTNATPYASVKFASIYAVVWGMDQISKLYPKNSMSMGIETEVYEPATVLYTPKDAVGSEKRLYKEGYVSFNKYSGVNVHDRFGLIRLANIYFDEGDENQMKAEYKRVVENMAFIEEVIAHKGFTGSVKYYCPEALIRKMRIARYLDGQVHVMYNDAQLNQIGQRHGLVGTPFILNDGVALTPEFMMSMKEDRVTAMGTV